MEVTETRGSIHVPGEAARLTSDCYCRGRHQGSRAWLKQGLVNEIDARPSFMARINESAAIDDEWDF